MKFIGMTIMFLLGSNLLIAQNIYLNFEHFKYNVKGNVKAFKETYFDITQNFGRYIEDTLTKNPKILIYDRLHNIEVDLDYGLSFFEYDNQGNILNIDRYSRPYLDELFKVSKQWDTINYKKFIDDYNSPSKIKFTYSNERLLEERDYSKDGSLSNLLTYKYLSNKEVTIQHYTYNFSPSYLDHYFYNSNGKLMLINKEDGKTTYQYDLNGNLIKESLFEYSYANKKQVRQLRLATENYYKNNLLIHSIKYDESKFPEFNTIVNYKYDNYNNEIYRRLKNGSENYIITTAYVYDNVGNWIKKITYKNNIPQEGIYRKIIYWQ